MSTVTATPTRARRRSAVAITSRHLIETHAALALAFLALVVVVVTVVLIVLDTRGEISGSAVQYARQGAIWFPFAIAISLSTGYLPVHVATGMTRRSFAVAAVAAAVVSGLLYALGLVALLVVERWTYGALGWEHRLDDGVYLSSEVDLGSLVPALALTFVTAQLCGLLVGAVYYRAGGGWGTLALPLTVGPLLLVTGVLGGSAGPFDGLWLAGAAADGADPAVRVVVSLVVVAVVAIAFQRVVRGAAIARPPA